MGEIVPGNIVSDKKTLRYISRIAVFLRLSTIKYMSDGPRRETSEEREKKQRKAEAKKALQELYSNQELHDLHNYSQSFKGWENTSFDEFLVRWNAIPQEQQRKAITVVRFINFVRSSSKQGYAEKQSLIDSDSNAKGYPEFREYTTAIAEALEIMKGRRMISDWIYVSQNRATHEAHLIDEQGFDIIVLTQEMFIYNYARVIQVGTSAENIRKKKEKMDRDYPELARSGYLGFVAVRQDGGTGAADMEELIKRLKNTIDSTNKIDYNVIFRIKR
jgi:hypothetical protein